VVLEGGELWIKSGVQTIPSGLEPDLPDRSYPARSLVHSRWSDVRLFST